MLSVHYRHPTNFTEELLEGAKKSFDRIKTSYLNLEHRKQSSTNLETDHDEWMQKIDQLKGQFELAMNDDFNTANAISVIFDVTREANLYLNGKQTSTYVIEAFQDAIKTLLLILGIDFTEEDHMILDEDIEAMIQEREEARKNRDFAKADAIRDELNKQNIILEDTAQGIRWRRG